MRKPTQPPRPAPMPLRPEDQGLPVIEVYEGVLGRRTVGTVSLTIDRQTWIAGVHEEGGEVYVGSFPSSDEAKSAVSQRVGDQSKPLSWVRRDLPVKSA